MASCSIAVAKVFKLFSPNGSGALEWDKDLRQRNGIMPSPRCPAIPCSRACGAMRAAPWTASPSTVGWRDATANLSG